MNSQPTEFIQSFLKSIKHSNAARFGAIGVVALLAASVGPQGMAVGPSQSHTNTPALATGGAMEARVVLASIPLTYDIVVDPATVLEVEDTYPVQSVGELVFPVGAIEVPWEDGAHTLAGPSAIHDPELATRGGNVSTPISNGTPRLMTAAFVDTQSVTGANALTGDSRSIILFNRSLADLNGNAEDVLDQLAASLQGSDQRIQLRAFGGNIADRTHAARRLALRRALSVRNYLMSRGIDQERITVRAMGGATDGGPSDRVDIVYPDGS